jgi:Collagenase and related proteases
MRLMVPASTLEATQELIDNGADDIYVGSTSSFFNYYSFNGRASIAKNGKQVLPTMDEIKAICSYVHSRDGCVYFLANIPIINGGSKQFYNKFLQYVNDGINAGADYIILGDISTIKWVTKKYPKIKIVASSYLEVQNELTLKMLEDMGVTQAILSYQSTLEEIQELCAVSNIQIEVFGHGGCSFYVGTCNMFHEMGESVNIGYPCRALYEVKQEEISFGEMRVLDCFKMCSLCKLKELDSYGVHSLKIVGRDLAASYILEIVKVYSRTLQLCRAGESLNAAALDLPTWWKKSWCSPGNLCRYGGECIGCNNSK